MCQRLWKRIGNQISLSGHVTKRCSFVLAGQQGFGTVEIHKQSQRTWRVFSVSPSNDLFGRGLRYAAGGELRGIGGRNERDTPLRVKPQDQACPERVVRKHTKDNGGIRRNKTSHGSADIFIAGTHTPL